MYLAQLKLSFSFDRYVCISHNLTFSLIWIVTLVYRAFIAVLKSHFDCYVNISRNFSSSLFSIVTLVSRVTQAVLFVVIFLGLRLTVFLWDFSFQEVKVILSELLTLELFFIYFLYPRFFQWNWELLSCFFFLIVWHPKRNNQFSPSVSLSYEWRCKVSSVRKLPETSCFSPQCSKAITFVSGLIRLKGR